MIGSLSVGDSRSTVGGWAEMSTLEGRTRRKGLHLNMKPPQTNNSLLYSGMQYFTLRTGLLRLKKTLALLNVLF